MSHSTIDFPQNTSSSGNKVFVNGAPYHRRIITNFEIIFQKRNDDSNSFEYSWIVKDTSGGFKTEHGDDDNGETIEKMGTLTVDWGDGTVETVNSHLQNPDFSDSNNLEVHHTYASSGTYPTRFGFDGNHGSFANDNLDSILYHAGASTDRSMAVYFVVTDGVTVAEPIATPPSITVTINASGGTSPIEYSIDGSTYQNSNIFNNVSLTAGNHTAYVRDPKGCTDTHPFTIGGTASANTTTSEQLPDLATPILCGVDSSYPHRSALINTGKGFTSIPDIVALFPTEGRLFPDTGPISPGEDNTNTNFRGLYPLVGSTTLTFGGGDSGLSFGTPGELDSEGKLTKWCMSNTEFDVDQDDDGPTYIYYYIFSNPLKIWAMTTPSTDYDQVEIWSEDAQDNWSNWSQIGPDLTKNHAIIRYLPNMAVYRGG